MKRTGLAVVIALLPVALFLVGRGAGAAEYVRKVEFGQAGDIVPYGQASFDLDRGQVGTYDAVCNIGFAPGFLYFLSNTLGLGAALQSGYSSRMATNADILDYNIGVAPKVTYKLTLTDEVTLLPEVSVGVVNSWEQHDSVAAPPERLNNGSQVTATVYLPLLVKPVGASRSGLTPTFTWDVSSRFTFNNGNAAPSGPLITPMNWPAINCQSTLGIHF